MWGHSAQLGETPADFLEAETLPLLDDRRSLHGNTAPADAALPGVDLFFWDLLLRRSPSSEQTTPPSGKSSQSSGKLGSVRGPTVLARLRVRAAVSQMASELFPDSVSWFPFAFLHSHVVGQL